MIELEQAKTLFRGARQALLLYFALRLRGFRPLRLLAVLGLGMWLCGALLVVIAVQRLMVLRPW